MTDRNKQESEVDVSIWRRFLSNEEEVFALLYNRHVQSLFAYGLRFTSDRESVKDSIQEVFIKLYRSKNELKHVTNIKTYLFISLKNNLINEAKRNQIHLKYIRSMDFSEPDDDTAEKQLIRKEIDDNTQRKIDEIMSSLTPRQREAVYYRFVDNLSIEDISALMQMNYQSVQNIIQRSVKKAKSVFLEKK